MENIKSNKRSDAQAFFVDSKVTADSSSFKENLKNKVLEHYINVNNQPLMKGKLAFLRHKPEFLLFGILAIFFILSVPVVLLLSKNYSQSNPILGAEVSLVEGSVEFKSPTTDWVAVNSNLLLKQGDSLRVNGEGRAVVNLDDGSAIRLNKDSEMTLSSLDTRHITISNDKGEIYTRFVKSDRVFEVKAKEVTYKSLGTAYKTVNTETQNGVEVYHNSVSILGVSGQNEILVEQGSKYFVVNTLAPDAIQKVIAVDINEISKDDFVKWNKDQDEAISEFKTEMGILFDLVPPSLTLSSPTDGLKVTSDKVNIAGTVEAGAKVTINGIETANNNGTFSYQLGLNVGTNSIKVVAADEAGNKTSIALTVTRENPLPPPPVKVSPYISLISKQSLKQVAWSLNFTSKLGFKVVWSKSSGPTYPTRSGDQYQYFSDPNTKISDVLSPFDGSGKYYVRVCEYKGGACGIYSNQVTIDL